MNSISRVIIANRGEIARRIAVTARRLGIEVAAITDRATPPRYLSSLVTHWLHVDREDVPLYLDGARLIALARSVNCDALHPGFGFLSENAEFAAACQSAELTFVGPSPESIAAMASKANAKVLAEAAKVSCMESMAAFVIDDLESAVRAATQFGSSAGYPLIIKAALGGGGKGMRLIQSAADLSEALPRAASEALAAFGDATLIVEKYLASPRHVEVQVLADIHGQTFAIGDRDCSLQRRHQKIIEEAPAPLLHESTRAGMHDAARRIAIAAKYSSAGTVEFLVDANAPVDKLQPFYFLEMNTRLQVEHPVTEETCGLDLVEWQFRIAYGERIPQSFASMQPHGHAVEARLYLENPSAGFYPAPGPILGFEPWHGPGIRWEIGIDPIDEITSAFDPMIGKLIAHGANREIALDRLAQALESSYLGCAPSNIPFIIEICHDAAFRRGGITTHFVETYGNELFAKIIRREGRLPACTPYSNRGANVQSSWAERIRSAFLKGPGQDALFPSEDLGSFSIALPSGHTQLSLRRSLDAVGDVLYYANASIGARRYSIVSLCGVTRVDVESPESVYRSGSHAAGPGVLAPMPAKIVKVLIRSGDTVAEQEKLFVLESMKMEIEIRSPRAGQVRSVAVKPGDQVLQGDSLLEWLDSEHDGSE